MRCVITHINTEMEAAFDAMNDIINGSDSDTDSDDDNLEDDDYNVELAAFEEQVRQMQAPVVDIEPRPQMIEVFEFDAENNVLDPEVRENFKTECIFEETHIFSSPLSTTNTMEGYLSNVSFHEKDLIEELLPDTNMVLYRCNYGKLKYEGYTEPVKERKTNRGRKKKEKKKKLRKKQGTGVDFNSQITFVARSSLVPEPVDGIIPYGAKVYKFKVFRTGKIQLPGVHQHLIDDVIACTRKIADVLNFHLHPGEENPTKITNVININPVMKNYKFLAKLPPGHIIDLSALGQVLARERRRQFDDVALDNGAPLHPPIFMLKYTRQDTKLSIKFSTPIYKNPKKKTRINIFMRGKINVLGAFQAHVTKRICEYLHWIFVENYDTLIVPEGVSVRADVVTWVENIDQESEEEFEKIYNGFLNWIPEVPYITQDEYEDIIEFVSCIYDDALEAADEYVRECLGDEWLSQICLK